MSKKIAKPKPKAKPQARPEDIDAFIAGGHGTDQDDQVLEPQDTRPPTIQTPRALDNSKVDTKINQNSGIPKLQTTGNPGAKISGNPDVQESESPNSPEPVEMVKMTIDVPKADKKRFRLLTMTLDSTMQAEGAEGFTRQLLELERRAKEQGVG